MSRALVTALIVIATGVAAPAPATQVITLTDAIDGGSGGLATDPAGNIYIGDFGETLGGPPGTRVFKVTPEGAVSVFATGFLGASGNTFGPDGALYQSNITASRIDRVTLDGVRAPYTSDGVRGPVGIIFDDAGDLFVCNCQTNQIQRITAAGESTVFSDSPLLRCPNGIARDDDGNLYVANFNNGLVVKLTPDGEASVLALLPGQNNGHLTYFDGRLWVAGRGANQIFTVTLDGEFSLFAGNGARGVVDGSLLEAGFSLPNDIAFSPDGRYMYVNDVLDADDSNDTSPMVLRRIELEPPPAEALAMPAVARISGAGAMFDTRWTLFNGGDDALDLELLFTPRQDRDGDPVTVAYSLPPGLLETAYPLPWLLGVPVPATVGSVLIRTPGAEIGDLRMHASVFAEVADGSHYGQFFPAVRTSRAVAAGEVAYLGTGVDPSRYRVNAGVMAVVDDTVVELTPEAPVGTPLAAPLRFQLDTGGNAQANDLDTTFGLAGRGDYVLAMAVESGAAVGFVSILDGVGGGGGTSDPTTILPIRQGSDAVTLLELGPIQGLDEFSGSATVTNLGAGATTVQATYHERGAAGIRATASFELAAGETTSWADVVGDLFGLGDSVGTIVLTADDGGLLMAAGREHAIFRDDGGAITGTAGQLMAGLTGEDLLTPGTTWHFLGLRQRETDGGPERSHVAFFNPGPEPVTVTMKLFRGATGEPRGALARTVAAGELIQVNNVIDRIDPGQDGSVHRLEVTVSGPVHGKAFRVNPDGDPITIDAL